MLKKIDPSQEGTSQARYFVSRLIPAHKDPAYEQVGAPRYFYIYLFGSFHSLIFFLLLLKPPF